MSKYQTPIGEFSARLHGARAILARRLGAVSILAQHAEQCGDERFAASLRGKRMAYFEAVHILEQLERGGALPRRRREGRSAPQSTPHRAAPKRACASGFAEVAVLPTPRMVEMTGVDAYTAACSTLPEGVAITRIRMVCEIDYEETS